jgi:hypothetical protein
MARRSDSFRRNERLERLLDEVGADLAPSEDRLLAQYRGRDLRHPLILVLGPLRSGTTLFTQWLANTGIVAYPTNLLSRFYRAPVLGAKLQLLLTDPRYSFRDELGEFMQGVAYDSENGKTRGVLAPNEFWYFWRRFLPDPDRDVWRDEELSAGVDVETLRAELGGVMDVLDKPFLAKAMLFNYNIGFLASVFERVVFVQLRRDPAANVASVLDARRRQFGSEEPWYSFEIPEYDELRALAPAEQVAGQVHYINRAIDVGLDALPERNKLSVEYEAFCAHPAAVYATLCNKLAANGHVVESDYTGERQFRVTRTYIDDPGIVAACRKFSGAA